MPLDQGSKLGQYEVLSSLGVGGMGEVYRARDTKLGREVAVKLLLESVSSDPERLARFEREARVLASLNHPNVATLYGFEKDGDTSFLVMELVGGETLAERIGRGPVPVQEATSLFHQIAEGLEAAHKLGVIHRDLKPANIKIDDEGRVKILDFGLAKALTDDDSQSSDASLSMSPTLTLAATQRGQILGTAAYMSPEQAKGKPVDRRTDVWAFGACLYEALSGGRLFAGNDAADVLASVLLQEPDWSALPDALPNNLKRLLRRCLQKEKRQRLHDMGDARLELEELEPPESESAPVASPAPRSRWLVGAQVLALGLAVGATWWFASGSDPEPEARPRTFEITTGDSTVLVVQTGIDAPAISPDGKSIAYIHRERLWIRELGQLIPRELPETFGAEGPFWSPDSRWVGYFVGASSNDGALRKVARQGGPSTHLGDTPLGMVVDAFWTHQGQILVTLARGVGDSTQTEIVVIPDEGGLFAPYEAAGGNTDVAKAVGYPRLLADAETLLLIEQEEDGTGTIVALREQERQVLARHPGEVAAYPNFVHPGYVVYQRGSGLSRGIWAFSFDLETLQRTSEPFELSPSGARPSVSDDGTLLFHNRRGTSSDQLFWVDRDGRNPEPISRPFQSMGAISLSPDGKRLLTWATEDDKIDIDVWLIDLSTGSTSRLTVNPGMDLDASWSPDGQNAVFVSTRNITGDIFIQSATGRGNARAIVSGPVDTFYPRFHPDGKGLLFHASSPETGWDLWHTTSIENAEPQPLIQKPGGEKAPEISFDGTLLLYLAGERKELYGRRYLTRYPSLQGEWQVSSGDASAAIWSPAGDEIFYDDPIENRLIAVPFEGGAEPQLGTPSVLFEGDDIGVDLSTTNHRARFATSDGQRFIVVRTLSKRESVATVMQDWTAAVPRN